MLVLISVILVKTEHVLCKSLIQNTSLLTIKVSLFIIAAHCDFVSLQERLSLVREGGQPGQQVGGETSENRQGNRDARRRNRDRTRHARGLRSYDGQRESPRPFAADFRRSGQRRSQSSG